MEYRYQEIQFLDILIKSDSSGIWMDLYYKPTNTQRCLPYSPKSSKTMSKNILFVITEQIYTIIENSSIKSNHLNELERNFETYGYPEMIVEIKIKKPYNLPNYIWVIQSH